MERQDSPEGSLIERARMGDRDAQDAVWHLCRRWVAAIILAHRPKTIEVDDLMQDVAVKFISRIDTLREPAAFRPWLRQIVINACRGAARGLRPTLRLTGGGPAENADSTSVSMPASPGDEREALERSEVAGRLLKQVISLPSEYREPLLLRSVRSLSYQQISELLDLPVTTIETRLARARRMLREEIGDELAVEGHV